MTAETLPRQDDWCIAWDGARFCGCQVRSRPLAAVEAGA